LNSLCVPPEDRWNEKVAYMNDIVISDTTALIILAKSDAFALLSNLFQKIYIPQAVYDELMFKDDIVNYRIKAFDNIELKPVSDMATLE